MEHSKITAQGEADKLNWLLSMGADLQEIPDERLRQFEDKYWLLAVKGAHRRGALDCDISSEWRVQSPVD